MLCVLSAYIVQALLNGVSPVLATLAAEYPDVPMTSIYLLATIISLCSIPTNIGVGWFVNKLGYKGTSIFGIAMILVGGIMPYFLPAFNMLLVSRVLMGLGYGLCFPLQLVL